MAPQPEVRIGERLRFYRTAKGKTQAVVAGLAGVTEDYLSQIERGLKTPTLPLIHRFSKILGVRVSELLGESATEHDERVHPIGYAVQRALMSYSGSDDSPDLVSLRTRVDDAWSIWQGSPHRYTQASEVLPELIVDVQAAQRGLAQGSSDERREAQRIGADLSFLLRTFTKRIGRTDLSLLVADRGVMAAEAADDPVRTAAAKWNLGHILLAQGETDGAEEVAMKAVEDLQRDTGDEDTDAVGMTGALWLVSAVAAVRNNDPWTARDRLRDKALPAARVTGDKNVMWTVFGPTNVGLHAVSVEMEMGEAGEALRLADDIDMSRSPSLERKTTFALEVARCYEQRRDDPGVFLHLVNAETSGPEDMRYNTLARELVQGLLKRARPTYAPQVRALAQLGERPSDGFVHSLLQCAARAVRGACLLIRALIVTAAVVCADETPVRAGPGPKTRKRYLPVACTNLLTCYFLGDRTLASFDGFVLGDLSGSVAVHDRYQNYDAYDGIAHQLCCAHLLRGLADAAEQYPGAVWPRQAADALRALIHAANQARDQGLDAAPADETAADLRLFRSAVLVGLQEVPRVPGANKKQKPGRMLLECLRDRAADVLRFLSDLRIPPTSNQAERDLRPARTQQKISGRLRSETATRNRYAIRGYASTAAKHGVSVLTALRDALAGNARMPALPDIA